MARRSIAFIFATVLVLSQVGTAIGAAARSDSPGPAAAEAQAKIDKSLSKKLEQGSARFVVEFKGKADLRPAYRINAHTRRGAYVRTALSNTAKASQADALKLVRNTKGSNPKSYWLTNVMVVTGDDKLAKQIAALDGVTAVRPAKVYPLVTPVKVGPQILAAAGDPEWGVEMIGADKVWADGITGQGVVVATIDTGVDYTHPALVEHYRGNNHDGSFSHDYNWWDPANACDGAPCDNVFHGTHTMGTILGGDGPGPFTPDIGVAPGAEWIAAKGCEDEGCAEESLLSSGQWVLAPTDLEGNNPDDSLRPDLVSNSWSNDNPDDPFYLETVQAWRAAGIIPIFAAGNAGPGCSTAGAPGTYNEVINVGATTEQDTIANFSSRGPSPTGKVSPNVTAPGANVLSSVPGGGYQVASGTSMATPHAAGAIALMLSARTELFGDFDGVLRALNSTAVDKPDDSCGTPDPSDNDPNYVYGEGRIDAKAAVDLVKTGGTLSGTVFDDATDDPIAGARVTADNGEREFSTTTDVDGNYSLFLAAGTYAATARAFGYAPAIQPGVEVATDEETIANFALVRLTRFAVSGHVTASEDGSPIRDASVVALGTPVPPTTTDAAGAYSLTLPVGDYTLRASAGGCTEVATAEISLVDANITQDFSLFRKLDDSGHGCHPIPFEWTDATTQSALYGDEFVGRLRLPFDFEFYGETYSQIFLSDNGYLNFLGPDQFNQFPIAIPSAAPPNGAIYPFWQDLQVDADSSIDYDTIGASPNRAFVIEYSAMKVGSSSIHVNFEVKLWEDGRIDMLYGPNPANPGDGRNAGIGIENATGADALEFSFLEGLIDPNTAFRYEHVPTGLVHGIVTDANDGEPIGGATVTAAPSGRHATTADDGTYTLRLRPGSYDLMASKGYYVDGADHVVITEGGDVTVDFSLQASVAVIDPTEVTATVDYGQTTTTTIDLSNPGSAPLAWTAKERQLGVELPPLPAPTGRIHFKPTWGSQKLPSNYPRVKINDTSPLVLTTIIDDPDDDSLDSNELTSVDAGSDGSTIATVAVNFAPSTPDNEIGGYVYFDVDQDPSTGLPAEALFGKPTQDVGVEYFATLFDVATGDGVPIWNADTGDLVTVVDAAIIDHTIRFDVPLEALGGDDGSINTALVVGFRAPSDWGPDEGHGTIEPFTDVPWMSEAPDAGVVEARQSQKVALTLGGATLTPGTYAGLLVFITNAPKQTQVPVQVTLTVTLPAEFGAISGTVTDAHSGEPLAGASVVVHTTWQGSPLDLAATTADDGTYGVTGPQGTWTTDFSLDGYVPVSKPVTIVAGVTTPGADAELHRVQPHAQLAGGPFTFILTPNRTAHGMLTLSNNGGHADLEFAVAERLVAPAPSAGTGTKGTIKVTGKTPASSTDRPAGFVASPVHPSITGEPSLVLLDTLPWDSDAIQATLTANGIAFDVAGSADMATLDFSVYHAIYVGNDQPQAFYDAYVANFDKFTGYVEAGGFLWFGAAAFGSQGSDLDGVAIPGGLTIHGPAYEDSNGVDAPDHPLAAGLPDPFTGTRASHVTFSDLPAGATIITHGTGGGEPTLVDYDLGAGHVVAVGQPVEYGRANGEPSGQILQNGVLYAEAFQSFVDLPWLSVTPTDGTVVPNDSIDLDVSVDTAGLAPGVHRGQVVIVTNDPDVGSFRVPVTVIVPAYQQGVNAGGQTYVNAAGDTYASDRAWSAGSFGAIGGGQAKSTGSPIGGTTEDGLYQDLRIGMTGYRFDLPNGHYRVDLSFAEILANKAGDRVFSVSLEGNYVLTNLDLFALAGKNTAYDKSVDVDVSDGHLDIAFVAQRGDKSVVNGILVTEMPRG